MVRYSSDDGKTRLLVLIATTLSSFLTPLSLSTVNVALPTIGRAFSMDAIALSWVATSYLLSASMFLLPFGRLADIYGRKRVYLIGMAGFTIASFLLGVAMNGRWLILFRAIQGIAAAMIFGTGIAILTSIFPANERGKALGINAASIYFGSSVGPFVGGILTQYLGWRSIFFLNVPFGIVIVLFSVLWIKGEWADAKGESFDYIGSFINCFMLFALMYSFSLLPSLSAVIFLIGGFAGFLIFVWWEIKTRHPLLNMELFRNNRPFALSNVAALINYSATFATGFLLSIYMQHIMALSPKTTGTVLLSQPLMQAIFSPVAGRVSDRIEPRVISSIGMGVTAIGLFMLAFLGSIETVSFITISLVMLGFGFALFASPNTNAVMSSVENRFYGVASSVLATMRTIGQTLSIGVAMLLFSIFLGRVELIPKYYPCLKKAIQTAFIVFGLLCTAGIFASLTRGDVHTDQDLQ